MKRERFGTCLRCGKRFDRKHGRSYRWVQRYCSRKCGARREGEHYRWRGAGAAIQSKRGRAERKYSMGSCQRCGRPGRDRHHKDGDPGNNRPSNVELLCRRCHMTVDGRLKGLREARGGWERRRQPPKPCVNCGHHHPIRRRGRCPACESYLRKVGIERPRRLWRPYSPFQIDAARAAHREAARKRRKRGE